MRILILGAGGIGGYFGSKIHYVGGDVTFLVRPARADNLRRQGLRITSIFGNTCFIPNVITSLDHANDSFDVIIICCKAYDLNSALESISPFVTDDCVILPLLNGVNHLDILDNSFGRKMVLGGVAHLAVSLSSSGEIHHLNNIHQIIIGARDNAPSKWLTPLIKLLHESGVDASISHNIEHDMWDKFVFLATLAGVTCTMRANIGEILNTCAGSEFILGMWSECKNIASASGYPTVSAQIEIYQKELTDRSSTHCASMLRDIERGKQTEAEHIIGDMVRRASINAINTPLLKIAYSHLQAYVFAKKRIEDDLLAAKKR